MHSFNHQLWQKFPVGAGHRELPILPSAIPWEEMADKQQELPPPESQDKAEVAIIPPYLPRYPNYSTLEI